jgi:hypothetical protein
MKLPVRIQKSTDALNLHRVYIVDADGERILSMYHKDFNDYATCIPDAEIICESINGQYKQKILSELKDVKCSYESLRKLDNNSWEVEIRTLEGKIDLLEDLIAEE